MYCYNYIVKSAKKPLRKLKAIKEEAIPRTGPLAKLAVWMFYGLLAYMPLHILLSTWVGTSFGILEIARVAKDVVLVAGFLLTFVLSYSQPWFWRFMKDRLVLLIFAYAIFTSGLALLRPTDQDAEILGVVYNLRYLLFFIYALLLARLTDVDKLRRASVKIVLTIAVVVVGFGVLQYLVIPDNLLSHFGYNRASGVLPAFFIDDKPDLERVMSTLRDPNSFGSYLIIIAPLAAAVLFIYHYSKDKLKPAILLLFSTLALWYTFSRSAWLGFAVALMLFFFLTDSWIKIEIYKRRQLLIPLIISGIVVLFSGLLVFKDTYFVQNVIFHADESTVLEDPNELRVRFWSESLGGIREEPLGHGPGTAGLTSIRNNVQGTVLNENYYLQIAWEVGVVGFLLFIAILFTTGWRLLEMRHDSYVATALFVSFAGLAITNFLVHIWSNEAVAYIWWGLAGLTVASTKHKKRTQLP
jgi:O-antigen ligase